MNPCSPPAFRECESLSGAGQFVLIAGSAFLVECFVVGTLFRGELEAGWAAIAHVAVVTLLGLWAWQLYRGGIGDRLPLLLTLGTAVLGPLGPAGALLTLGLYRRFEKSATPFQEWYDSLFPDAGNSEFDETFERLLWEQNLNFQQNSVIPFMDILHYGTQRQKQTMIVLLIKHYHGKFAPVLKQALLDEDNSVRVLAAKGMAEIEYDFMKRFIDIQRGEEGIQRGDAEWLKMLGSHYDDYLYSGILDDVREEDYRQRAIKAYEGYLVHRPDDSDIPTRVGRILMRGEKIVEAADWFEDCINQGIRSPSILIWYFESLYLLGQFQKLREKAAIHYDELENSAKKFPINVLDAVRAWSRPDLAPPEEIEADWGVDGDEPEPADGDVETEAA